MAEEKSPGSAQSPATGGGRANARAYELSLCGVALAALLLGTLRILIDTFHMGRSAATVQTDLTAIGLLGIAMVALVLLRVGPLTRLKLWDTEAQFANAAEEARNNAEMTSKDLIARLEEMRAAIGALAGATAGGNAMAATATAVLQSKEAPALGRQRVHEDDPWKGRFGGQAQSGGYSIDATFKQQSARIVRVTLVVTAPNGATGHTVEFFLHPTFPRSRVRVAMENGTARLELAAWGGFTVGAWIAEDGVELELDLSTMPNAPAVIREL